MCLIHSILCCVCIKALYIVLVKDGCMLVVVKRDGCRTAFDGCRIKEAVVAAMESAGIADHQYAQQLAQTVEQQMTVKTEVDIHELQDAVENLLMSGPFKSVARHYIEYRHDRDKHRETQSKLNCAIRGLVEQSDSAILNENANKDAKVIPYPSLKIIKNVSERMSESMNAASTRFNSIDCTLIKAH